MSQEFLGGCSGVRRGKTKAQESKAKGPFLGKVGTTIRVTPGWGQ